MAHAILFILGASSYLCVSSFLSVLWIGVRATYFVEGFMFEFAFSVSLLFRN